MLWNIIQTQEHNTKNEIFRKRRKHEANWWNFQRAIFMQCALILTRFPFRIFVYMFMDWAKSHRNFDTSETFNEIHFAKGKCQQQQKQRQKQQKKTDIFWNTQRTKDRQSQYKEPNSSESKKRTVFFNWCFSLLKSNKASEEKVWIKNPHLILANFNIFKEANMDLQSNAFSVYIFFLFALSFLCFFFLWVLFNAFVISCKCLWMYAFVRLVLFWCRVISSDLSHFFFQSSGRTKILYVRLTTTSNEKKKKNCFIVIHDFFFRSSEIMWQDCIWLFWLEVIKRNRFNISIYLLNWIELAEQ